VQAVSPRFFEALGIPLREGRDFDERDREDAPKAVIVSETFAARMFPGEPVLGRRLVVWETTHTIVGVVGDVRFGTSLWDPPEPQMYFRVGQLKQDWLYVVIRTSADPTAIGPDVRATMRRLDPTLPLTELGTMEERLDRATAPQRFRGALLGVLGALAFALSVIGIYSVVAYAVSLRTREIGIRLALGEARTRLRRRVVREALVPGSLGTVAGIAAALVAGRWLESFLLGVGARDPATFAAVASLFLLVTALAAYAPARRASNLDPTIALRTE
jgi:predicted permease